MNRTRLAIVVVAAARNASSVARACGNANHIALRREVRHQSPVGIHGEGIVSIGRNHISVFRPVGESVTRIGRGMNRAVLALLICAPACYCAAIRWAGRHCNGIAWHLRCGEAHFTTVCCASAIGGVCAHIVCCVRSQASQAARETSRARTIGSMAAAYGWVMARAPTHATSRHICAAAVGHIATTCGSCGGDVGNLVGSHGGHCSRSLETHFVTIARAFAVLGVGTHIVGRVGCQTCHIHSIGACTSATVRMAAARRRVVARAPADAALCHRGTAVARHVATACSRGLGDVCHLACRHRGCRVVLRGLETHLVAITGALAVDGVGAHIVGGVRRQASNVDGVAAHARTAGGMAAAGGRVVAGAPTDAALGHLNPAVVGHIAAALRCSLRDVAHFLGGHRGLVGRGAESHFVAVGGANIVSGVCAHIVSGARGKIGEFHTETAHTRAARGMGPFRSRGMFGTPTDAALGHLRAAVRSHLAMGSSAINAARHNSGRTDVVSGCELHFLTIRDALCILGECPHKIGGVGREVRYLNGICSRSRTIVGMAAFYGWAVFNAPAQASARHIGAAIVGYVAAGQSRSARDVSHLARSHGRQLSALCREIHFIAIIHHIIAHGVGFHIVLRMRLKACDIYQKRSRALPTDQMRAL